MSSDGWLVTQRKMPSCGDMPGREGGRPSGHRHRKAASIWLYREKKIAEEFGCRKLILSGRKELHTCLRVNIDVFTEGILKEHQFF